MMYWVFAATGAGIALVGAVLGYLEGLKVGRQGDGYQAGFLYGYRVGRTHEGERQTVLQSLTSRPAPSGKGGQG
jgi:hypothetical protein